MERVQRRFTRMVTMVPELKNLQYDERLNCLNLWSLEERRVRADLIEHRRTSTPHFLDWGVPYPPLFRTQVKNLLSSEAICGDQITLKPFSAGAPPRTPSTESSRLVSFSKYRRKFAGGLSGLSPQTLTRLYLFLLTCATICFLALYGAAKPWNYYFDVFYNFHN